jgi:alpha-galactosidase
VSWSLPTATATYTVAMAGEGAGPVLQDWSDQPVRAWQPTARQGFETDLDRLPSEFSALGGRHVRGAELVVDHGDGLVGARLVWEPNGVVVVADGAVTRLTAAGCDTTRHLAVELVIETSRAHDVVRKWVTLTNVGPRSLRLERAFGPAWELPIGPGTSIDCLAGAWSREFTPFRVALPVGELSLGSRQGITSHTFSPTLRVAALDRPDGPAYGLALAWSGSWRLLVDAPPFRERIRVAGGVDDESTVITLLPGESFITPPTLGVFAPDGADGVRRRWHDYQRGWLARDLGLEQRPIVYNSWYATTFDVREEHQLGLADVAAELGVEVFVIDDGWFAGRCDDRSGLGNWWPDPERFPAGLDSLISGVVARGMRFGLWVEPEAVNPGSDVLIAHPDWIYRAADRPLVTVRGNQYVLDFGRPDVLDWTESWLRDLLADRRITYLKWDMNRPVSDGGRPGDDHGRQWAVQHAEGYYRVMRMLRAEFPHVTVEACSGGGGRIDAAVLALSDVVWPSDETGPRDRAAIQHGFLSSYGPHVMSSWVTDQPDRLDTEPASFEYRFVVAMAGVLGIGSDLLAWTVDQRSRAAELVALYRSIRTTIHIGRVELHGTPADPVHAIEYGSSQQTVLLVYGRAARPDGVVLAPKTLRADATYQIVGTDRQLLGAEALQGIGVPFALAADADVIVLEVLP